MAESNELKARILELQEKLAKVRNNSGHIQSTLNRLDKISVTKPQNSMLAHDTGDKQRRVRNRIIKTKKQTVSSLPDNVGSKTGFDIIQKRSETKIRNKITHSTSKIDHTAVGKKRKWVAATGLSSNKLQKTNSFKRNEECCLFYMRYGRCRAAGKCVFVHDSSKVAVCRSFLQGQCTHGDACLLSHQIDPVTIKCNNRDLILAIDFKAFDF